MLSAEFHNHVNFTERLRAEAGWVPSRQEHLPNWRIVQANARFRWLMDGERAVGLLDEKEDNFELRVADPWSPCPAAELPRHYHIVTYTGVRAANSWWLRGWSSPRVRRELTCSVREDGLHFGLYKEWEDGSFGTHRGRLHYDPDWGGYVAEMSADLTARRIAVTQEFCNLIPRAIGDTRPGREQYQQVVWLDREGTVRGMRKNPLWFDSVGAQDITGRRGIPDGGFLGWVSEPDFNPFAEILEADPVAGSGTCDNLMDEHLQLGEPEQSPDGWFHQHVRYRLFSLPLPLAQQLAAQPFRWTLAPMTVEVRMRPIAGPSRRT